VEPGNEKAPRMRETLRIGGPCWAHSDEYMPECADRSSHRSNSLVNGGQYASGLCPQPVNPAPKMTAVLA
jgi:hypothetical protein